MAKEKKQEKRADGLPVEIERMVMRDCNDCIYIWPTERQQTEKKEAHICWKETRPVFHNGRHPFLPTPAWCPLIKPVQVELASA